MYNSIGSLGRTWVFSVFWRTNLRFIPFIPELQGAGETWAAESSSDWLDLVFPGDRVLQEKVGGGQGDGI